MLAPDYGLLQQVHSYIIQSCLKVVNPPTPESMLFAVEESRKTSLILCWTVVVVVVFFFGGGGTVGEDRYVHCAKRGRFMKVSQLFCHSLYFTGTACTRSLGFELGTTENKSRK